MGIRTRTHQSNKPDIQKHKSTNEPIRHPKRPFNQRRNQTTNEPTNKLKANQRINQPTTEKNMKSSKLN